MSCARNHHLRFSTLIVCQMPRANPQAKAALGTMQRISFNRFILRLPQLLSVALVRCKAVFEGLDHDGDGCLNREELQEACRRLGYHLSDDRVQQLFLSVDADNSDSLRYTPWTAVA